MKYAALLVTILALLVIGSVVAQHARNSGDDDPMTIIHPDITVLEIRAMDDGTYLLNLDEMWIKANPALPSSDQYGARAALPQLQAPMRVWAKLRNDGEGNFTLQEIRVLEQGNFDENGDFVLTPKRWRPDHEGRMDYVE